MPPKLAQALKDVATKLRLQTIIRDRATSRMKARHAEQKKAERQADAASTTADRLRSAGHVPKAQRKDAKALRLIAKAEKAKVKAIIWKQKAKAATQAINGLSVTKDELEADLARWQKTHKPHIGKDGKVAGASSKGEAAIFAAKYIATKCAGASRPNYYSMTGGGFNVTHPLLKGDQKAIGQVPYERSDCSLFVTEVCWAADLPDPNGEDWHGGYTGTLVGQHNGWKLVSEATMRKKGWGYIVYGSGVGHHTEFYVGEGGDDTIGHGSPPVDTGIINLFGDGDYRCYIYEGKN